MSKMTKSSIVDRNTRLTIWIKRALLASTVLSIVCLVFTIVMIQAEYHMAVEPDAKGEFEDLVI